MKQLFAFATLCVCVALSSVAAERGRVNLFNGKNLQGWTQHGGKAKYEVKDKSIVGTTVPNTPNSFLCTDKQYGDFILDLEFKVHPALNSGVQIRSQVFDHEVALDVRGKEIKIPADRVHGYQVEIDMDSGKNRWWVGGIYDEARRGWLYPGLLGGDGAEFTSRGVKLAKPDAWNKIRVEAKGDTIKTYLNGKLRAEIKDGMTREGLIALQVHSIGRDASKEGLTVAWRNIRLKQL